MFGLKEGLNNYNYDLCGMVSYTISDKNICYQRYPCSTSFVPRLTVFVFENIRICIRIRSYPYSNSNLTKNMKTNMISLISVRIRSDYTPTLALTLKVHKESQSKGGISNSHKTQNQSNDTHTSRNKSSQQNPMSSQLN